MTEIVGWLDGLTPRVRLVVGGLTVDCVVDTGFDGDLMLPRSLVEKLGSLRSRK